MELIFLFVPDMQIAFRNSFLRFELNVGFLPWRQEPLMLLQDVAIGHACNKITDNAMQRLMKRFFLIGGGQFPRRLDKEREHLCNYLLRLVLIALQRRIEIDVFIEKLFYLPALFIHRRTESKKPPRKAADLLY